MWFEKYTKVVFLFTKQIEKLKSTGWYHFNFNIQMDVPHVQLIVYSDVGLLESHILQQNGANMKKKKSSFFGSWKEKWPFAKGLLAKDSEKEWPGKCYDLIPLE